MVFFFKANKQKQIPESNCTKPPHIILTYVTYRYIDIYIYIVLKAQTLIRKSFTVSDSTAMAVMNIIIHDGDDDDDDDGGKDSGGLP